MQNNLQGITIRHTNEFVCVDGSVGHFENVEGVERKHFWGIVEHVIFENRQLEFPFLHSPEL